MTTVDVLASLGAKTWCVATIVGVVLSIALWELNLLLVSQRTGNLAYLTALLPQTAASLFSGHVMAC